MHCTIHSGKLHGGTLRRTLRQTLRQRRATGFTLLELIVVVTMIGILAAIAMPNLIQMPRRAKESVLVTNLRTIRQAIDQHYADLGYYPEALEGLVDEGYLRNVPIDPILEEREWELIYETADEFEELPETDLGEGAGVIDIHSLSEDLAIDGSPYADW